MMSNAKMTTISFTFIAFGTLYWYLKKERFKVAKKKHQVACMRKKLLSAKFTSINLKFGLNILRGSFVPTVIALRHFNKRVNLNSLLVQTVPLLPDHVMLGYSNQSSRSNFFLHFRDIT